MGGLTALDVAQDFLELAFVDNGTHGGISFRIRVSNMDLLDLLSQALDDLVVDSLVDERARGGGADLTGGEEDTHHNPFHSLYNIHIVKDNDGALAAKL